MTQKNFRNSDNCPSCEYERGTLGKPVRQGSQVFCLECGNSWKEIVPQPVFGKRQRHVEEKHPEIRHHSVSDTIQEFEGLSLYDTPRATGYLGTGVVLAAMTLFVMSIFSVWYFVDHQTPLTHKNVHVASVSFEEVLRPGSGKVVKVEGLVRNNTKNSAPIKRVEIILRNSSGSEVGRWYHASRIPVLKPGKSMQFMSAVPVNAVVIASVEARLQ